jgi:protein-disulfide isomerase
VPTDQLTPSRKPTRKPTAKERIAARRAEEAARAAAAARRRRTVTGATVGAVLLAAAMIVAIVVQSQRTATSADAAVPAHTADDGTVIAVGRADAPVIDVYEDFLCPACARFESMHAGTLAQLAEDGDALVRYHPIAFLDRASTDRYSTRALNAAAAVVDAAGPEAFVRFAGLLYAQQPAEGGPGLSDDRLVELAAAAGAEGPEVERAIRELAFEDWTRTVTDHASKQGVVSTPTVLLDGEPLSPVQLQPGALAAVVRGV